MAKELLQYDIAYDRFEKDRYFITTQLETHLKERFHVLLSIVDYGIVDGHLVRQGTNEPFTNVIARGRDYIRTIAPNSVDFDREDAEVEGFEKIDAFLSDPNTPLGSKTLSISPKGEEGSKYQHNFYDIFTLKRKNEQRFVELRRYSSALTPEDYVVQLPGLYPRSPTAADFLANPIPVTDIFISAEQIHKELHREHDYTTTEDFEEIWQGVQPAVNRYLGSRDANSFNAILNLADKVWESQKKRKKGEAYIDYKNYFPSYAELRDYGNEEVRQVSGGCPGKSGAENSPFSVSEFANIEPDKYGKRTFDCPKCGKTNTRPKNELLKNCQHCGSNKVAC